MPDESNASTQDLTGKPTDAEQPANKLAEIAAARAAALAAKVKAEADAANGKAAAAEPSAPLSKVTALEDRLAALEGAVASLGSLHMTQTHDSLSGFRAWWEGWVEKVKKAL